MVDLVELGDAQRRLATWYRARPAKRGLSRKDVSYVVALSHKVDLVETGDRSMDSRREGAAN
jgi:hypothetical protein